MRSVLWYVVMRLCVTTARSMQQQREGNAVWYTWCGDLGSDWYYKNESGNSNSSFLQKLTVVPLPALTVMAFNLPATRIALYFTLVGHSHSICRRCSMLSGLVFLHSNGPVCCTYPLYHPPSSRWPFKRWPWLLRHVNSLTHSRRFWKRNVLRPGRCRTFVHNSHNNGMVRFHVGFSDTTFYPFVDLI